MVLIHILGGGLALLAGYVALYSRKGAPLHRRSGTIFVWAMLVMSLTGTTIAAMRGVAPSINVPAGLVTAYLVITALSTVRSPSAAWRRLNAGAMLAALAIGTASFLAAFQLLGTASGARRGMAFPLLMFGTVALLGAAGDFRMLRAGGLQGTRRIARHLWRMSFALLVAALSFFIGQADVIPGPNRIRPLLATPVVAVLVTMLYWVWRMRAKGVKHGNPVLVQAPTA